LIWINLSNESCLNWLPANILQTSLLSLGVQAKRHPTTTCRVKRHLKTTTSHEHGSPAETKPDRTIRTQGVKMFYILLDPKLYLKVLRIKALM